MKPASRIARRHAPSGRDLQRAETRQRIYAAALTIFRRDGVAGARIEDIVRAAEVSHGTFYFHFATKDDVLAQLLAESSERVAQAVRRLSPRASLEAHLRSVCGAMAKEWQNDPALLPAVGTVALRQSAEQRAGTGADSVRQAVGQRFVAAARHGELSELVAPELLAEFFLMTMFSAALAWCAHPMMPLDQVLQGVATLFLNGARPQAKKR